MSRLASLFAAILVVAIVTVGCGSGDESPQTAESTPTPAIGQTVDVESVVRRVLAEQRGLERPLPTPQAVPTVDVESVVRRVLAEERGLETPLPTPQAVPTVDVESVVRRVLAEQRGLETPLPTPRAVPTVDVEALVRNATERVLATLEAWETPLPTPQAVPTATRRQTLTITPAPRPTATPTPTRPPNGPIPVNPRLRITMAAPTHQARLPYMTFQSSSGPLHNLYDYLVGKDRRTDNLDNDHLAKSWWVTRDGRRWTFELKDNIPYYMNGEASSYIFSPEDVRWTWLLQAGFESDRANNSGTWRPLLASEDGSDIEIHGYTVAWNLDLIHPDAVVYLSEDWTFGLISKAYWDDVGGEYGYINHPVGTGSFSFVEYIDNKHFLLERNVGHYRKEPEFHELQFLWVSEPSTRIAMLLASEVHIAQLHSVLHDQLKSHGMKIAKSTLPSFFLWGAIPYYQPVGFNGEPTPNYDETVPTRNVKVREALNIAIDRAEINDKFFKGDAIPSAVSHFAEWWNFFQDRWAPIPGPDGNTGAAGGWPYPYDPERAKELLVEAGYPEGFELDFFAPTNLGGLPEIPDVGEAIAHMWEEIGITVNLTISEYALIQSMVADRAMNGKIYMIRWNLNLPSAGMGWLWRKATRPYYEYPFITEWKENYDTILDAEERDRLAIELGDFWYDNYLSIPLLWIFASAVYNPEFLEGYEVNQFHFGPTRYHEYTVPVYR